MDRVPTPSTPNAPRAGRSLPDLRALDTFVSVCETGSMALAAQRLGVTQSAVSQAVRALEAEHGASLFDRDVRPVRPRGPAPCCMAWRATCWRAHAA